jgi:putative transposase
MRGWWRAENWRWSSLASRRQGVSGPEWPELSPWPVDQPRSWLQGVNRPQTAEEEAAIQQSMARAQPLGKPGWQRRTAVRLGLDSTFRPRGRPRRTPVGEE